MPGVSLQQMRLRYLLSANELGHLAGVAASTVLDIEAGAVPRLSTVRKLSSALRCQPQDIAWPGDPLSGEALSATQRTLPSAAPQPSPVASQVPVVKPMARITTLLTLREARERAALSQAELAEQCNLSRAAINRIELGMSFPRGSTRRAIAAVLGLAPAEIIWRHHKKDSA